MIEDNRVISIAYEMFGFDIRVDYGEDGFKLDEKARRIDPFGDKELSELMWDLLCVAYSKAYSESGDISEGAYEKDRTYFKKKWLSRKPSERVKQEIDKNITEAKKDILYQLLIGGNEDDNI